MVGDGNATTVIDLSVGKSQIEQTESASYRHFFTNTQAGRVGSRPGVYFQQYCCGIVTSCCCIHDTRVNGGIVVGGVRAAQR